MAVIGWGLVLVAMVFTIVAAANTSQALMLDAGQLAAAAASTLASRSLFLLSNG
ncbi:hypothetical protein [Leucobacter insecticola]|uniref:hypothetical protein n=1 Tax=Leucobacter insecticola TaxID=2714934 RepID=UPI001FCC39FA|nr:hypothetical protein [Leucobacter insecticola]